MKPKKGMSWPVRWLVIIVVLVVGYGVGQALHLDHKTPATAVSTVSTQH
jgi:hypothetical protein